MAGWAERFDKDPVLASVPVGRQFGKEPGAGGQWVSCQIRVSESVSAEQSKDAHEANEGVDCGPTSERINV